MTKKTAGQIAEIGGHIEQFADEGVRKKVMEGCEKVAVSSDMQRVSLWVKDAMDRLDASTDTAKREQIMLACGYNCMDRNNRPMQMAKSRRQKYPTEEAFLVAEVLKPPRGMRFERKGDMLLQYYTPHKFGKGMRCYCSLLRALPERVTVSPTYCQCSRGFVQKYWEGILVRPVRVELRETAISGAEECKFIIYL
jgi:hypothetical protein